MKNLIFLLFGMVLFASCNEEPLDTASVIDEPAAQTELDKWFTQHYTYPYNIAVKYKLEDIESDRNYTLAPAKEELCLPLGKVLEYIWLDTFSEVVGPDFMRANSPKILLYVGSWAYNTTSNTHTMGTAESGMKITLYGVNEFAPENLNSSDEEKKAAALASLKSYMKTVIHEFAHILHQKKAFDPEYEKISSGDYVDDNWRSSTYTEPIAQSLGFYTRYSRKNVNEDFVEIIAYYIVYGQEMWDGVISSVSAEAAAKLQKKFNIIKEYLTNTWGIDIYTFNRVLSRRLNTVDKINLN